MFGRVDRLGATELFAQEVMPAFRIVGVRVNTPQRGTEGSVGWTSISVTGQIVDAAMRVHSHLGPGLLESAYEACLTYELQRRGFRVPAAARATRRVRRSAHRCRLSHRPAGGRPSWWSNSRPSRRYSPIHRAQLLSYLRLSRKRVGLLLNFNVRRLRDGIERFVNEL